MSQCKLNFNKIRALHFDFDPELLPVAQRGATRSCEYDLNDLSASDVILNLISALRTHLQNAFHNRNKRFITIVKCVLQMRTGCINHIIIIHWTAARENRSSRFPTRSDTNRPIQSQKKARLLEFRI